MVGIQDFTPHRSSLWWQRKPTRWRQYRSRSRGSLSYRNTRLFSYGRVAGRRPARVERERTQAAGAAGFSIAPVLPVIANAASFLASALLLRTIPPTSTAAHTTHHTSLVSEIRVGLRWLTHHTELATLALATATINLATAASTTFIVLYLREAANARTTGYTIVLICAAVGALGGNLLAERHPTTLQHPTVIPIAVAPIGLALITTGTVPNTIAIALGFTAIGLAGAIWNITTVTRRQHLVPLELLGRVHSAYRLLAYGATPIGAIAGGLIARNFGLAATFHTAGGLLLATAITLDQAQRHQTSSPR